MSAPPTIVDSMSDNHARLSPALVETLAGFTAGIASTVTAHPLDVIKTRLQIHRGTSNVPINSLTVFRSLIHRNRPIQAIYRGLTPNLIGNSTSWAIFFYFKSSFENRLRIYHKVHSSQSSPHPISGNVLQSNRHGGQHLSPVDYFIASGTAGLITSAITNPIWVLKTRMLSSDKGSQGAYPSMSAGAKDVWAMEGWRGFYRGLGASCLGVSHGAVQFAVYEPLKRSWLRYFDTTIIDLEEMDTGVDKVKLGNGATVLISATSKMVAGTATYPYQVIRSRMQTYDAEKRFGKGIRGVFGKVWREDGVKGFYKGVGPNILRVMPATLVTFLTYENMKFYLTQWGAPEGVST